MICLVPLNCIIRSSATKFLAQFLQCIQARLRGHFPECFQKIQEKGAHYKLLPPIKKIPLLSWFSIFLSKIHEKKGGVNCTLIVHHCLLECRKNLLYEKRSISLFYGFAPEAFLQSCFENSIDRKTCFFVQLPSHNADWL